MTLMRRIEMVDYGVAKVLGAKSGMERLRLAHEAWDLARARLAVFLSARHPEWPREKVLQEVARRLSHESG